MKVVHHLLSAAMLMITSTASAQIFKADSLLSQYKYPEALEIYKSFNPQQLKCGEAMNAAIAAAQCDEDSLAVMYVGISLEADPSYFDERISVTELLQDCRLLPEWEALQSENERRLENAMHKYDIPLRRELLEIYHSDQNVRGHLIMASRQTPPDQQKLSELYAEMVKADSINYAKAIRLLDTYGWIPRSKVGAANQALFFVIQHATPDVIDRYIPIFEVAANNGDIPKDLFAKMYDRQLLYAGKPQKYGTQRVRKEAGNGQMVLWKIEDPDNVNALRREMGLPPLEDFPQ